MKVKYYVTIDDVVAFNLYHFKNSPTMRKQTRFYRIIIPGIIIIPFLLIGILTQSFGHFLAGIIVAVILSLTYSPFAVRHVKKTTRSLYGEGKNEGLLGEHILEVTDTDIIMNSDSGEDRTKISALERVEIGSEHAFIYVSAITAFIIPRNSVLEGDFDLVIEEIRKRLAQSR